METLNNRRAREERSNAKCLVEENEKDIRLQHIKEKRSLEKIDTRRNNVLFRRYTSVYLFALALFWVSSIVGVCDSLWTPDFKGYVTDQARVQAGDVIVVKINSDFSLAFNSSSKDSKSLTLEFSGGEYGSLLDFLPDVTTGGARQIDGKEGHSLTADVVTRVTQISSTGQLFIQGSQTLTVEGKQQSLTLSGWVDPKDLGPNKEVSFSRVAESRLIYRSFLQPGESTLTNSDLEAIFESLNVKSNTNAATTGQEGTTTTSETQPQGGTTTTTAPSSTNSSNLTGYKLTEAKKKELFLLYVNRLVDILFR
jgi:flagellar L-ring protein precursor FlgH